MSLRSRSLNLSRGLFISAIHKWLCVLLCPWLPLLLCLRFSLWFVGVTVLVRAVVRRVAGVHVVLLVCFCLFSRLSSLLAFYFTIYTIQNLIGKLKSRTGTWSVRDFNFPIRFCMGLRLSYMRDALCTSGSQPCRARKSESQQEEPNAKTDTRTEIQPQAQTQPRAQTHARAQPQRQPRTQRHPRPQPQPETAQENNNEHTGTHNRKHKRNDNHRQALMRGQYGGSSG